MIELIVFDMAGTTVKDLHEVEACFAQAAFETGLMVTPERILALQGYSKIEVIKMLWNENQSNLSESVLKIKVDKSYKKFCQILESHYIKNAIEPTEGCLELFEFLKNNNIKIGLTTGFYRKVTDIILKKLGWLDGLNSLKIGVNGSLIDVSIASDEVLFGRPKPDMIFRAIDLLNIKDSQKVISIGDTPSDIIAGKAANIFKSFGITNGTHSQAQLAEYQSDGLFSSLDEFQKYIQQTINK